MHQCCTRSLEDSAMHKIGILDTYQLKHYIRKNLLMIISLSDDQYGILNCS